MSTEGVSEHDQVIALMAEQGISRVKATKLLYEQSKLKKKDAGKIEINITQGENSVVKNQIDRFNSQRDLSNATTQVHHDIDMSQEGRPVLKLDAEASFRYTSTGPRISPLANNLTKDEPTFQDPSAQTTQQSKFPPRARADTGTGSDEDDEVVTPYEEDKFNDPPVATKTRIESRTVTGAISGFDDGGWNGEVEEDDSFNATTASMPNSNAKRRSSNASLNSLRPLSRLHPGKFRDSLSSDHCDLDDEDYSDSEGEAGTTDKISGSARGQPQRRAHKKDIHGDEVHKTATADDSSDDDGHGASSSPKLQGERLVTRSSIQQAHTEHHHSQSIHSQSTHSLTFSPNITPTGLSSQHRPSFRDDPRLSALNGGLNGGSATSVNKSEAAPPSYMTNEQRQQQFSHGAQGSWSSGAQSNAAAASSESKSYLSQPSAQNVQQLAVEEKLALLNAGRSPRHASFAAPPAHAHTSAAQQAAVSAMNVKVGTKKLTIRGASSGVPLSQSQEEMLPPPPEYLDEHHQPQQYQAPPSFNGRSLPAPPLPPPAYEEVAGSPFNAEQPRRRPSAALDVSMMDNIPRLPAEEPLPDFLPDSEEEDEDGLTQEERTAALMAKYRRRSYMKPNNTPEAFRDLEPVDPAVAREAVVRREQELRNAGTWVPPASLVPPVAAAAVVTATTDSSAMSTASTSNVNTTESLAGSATFPPQQPLSGQETQETEEYAHIVPSHTAVEAVMHKESNDLIEELVQQGYSRENAVLLAKEIELDRRAGRFHNNNNPNSHSGSSDFNQARGPSSYSNNTYNTYNNTTSSSMGWQEAAAAANHSAQYSTYNPSNSHKNAYNQDDDLGSVISNISAASRQSNFGETDRLLMNLLLAQQKARYGINMYESLENSDEPMIERYMNKGMSLDQAVLKLFEKKYGPVDSQQLPRQVLPYKGSGGSVSGTSIAVDSEEAHEIVATMHAEIELLMLSGNYSRDVAVRMLLNKVAKERAQKQQAGSLSLDMDPDPYNQQQQHSAKSMHRASSMNAMGSPSGRGHYASGDGSVRGGGSDLHSESGYSGAGGYEVTNSDRGERRLHATRSMYDAHSSRNIRDGGGGGSVISERSSRSQNTNSKYYHPDHHLPGDHYQDDYAAHYHEQEYTRGPNGAGNRDRTRSGDKYIIHHHYQAPPSPVVLSSTSHTSNVSVTSTSHSAKRRPSASNSSVMSGGSRAVEDSAYIPTLLAEQEAKYGVNMFEYLAPDDPEVNRLMRDFNFTRTDAMIAVFQQFPPQLATPTPTQLNSSVSNKSTGSGGGSVKGIAAHSPMKPPQPGYTNPPNINNNSGNSIHSTSSHHYGSSSHSIASSQSHPAPSASASVSAKANTSAYDEEAELERVMKLSMQEHNNKPGAVSMPGTSSKSTSSSLGSAMNSSGNSQDVATLVGMGFTSTQAREALQRCNFDVHKAADHLLGCM